MLAGATGNLRDRVDARGGDRLHRHRPPPGWNWPAFNLADLWLAIGLVLCAVALIRQRRYGNGTTEPDQ